jgi:hypothetical protein
MSTARGLDDREAPPGFQHIAVQNSHALIESYCLECNRFVGASRSLINLRFTEIAHRASCKIRRHPEIKKAADSSPGL